MGTLNNYQTVKLIAERNHCTNYCGDVTGINQILVCQSEVAQLVQHQAAMREVVSSTPAGPTLRVFK